MTQLPTFKKKIGEGYTYTYIYIYTSIDQIDRSNR